MNASLATLQWVGVWWVGESSALITSPLAPLTHHPIKAYYCTNPHPPHRHTHTTTTIQVIGVSRNMLSHASQAVKN